MMPGKMQKQDDDHHDDEKNPKKKCKAVTCGGTMGVGGGQPSSDSGGPELDINSTMQMTTKPLKFNKPALASKEQETIRKPVSQRADAFTATLGSALEDITGFQLQGPLKPPKVKKARKKEPPPPAPSTTQMDPAPSDSEGN